MILAIAGTGAVLGLFLLLVLVAKTPKREPDLWLGAWLSAQSIFCGSVVTSQMVAPVPALAALVVGQTALFALGPAQYLYAASALGARPRYVWHALAVAAAATLWVAVVLAAPFEAANGAIVTEVASGWVTLTPLGVIAIVSLYPLAVLRLVERRRESLKDRLSTIGDADPQWLRIWAFAMLAVLAILAFALVARALTIWSTDAYVTVGLAIQVASVAYVGQRGLTRSGVFFVSAPPARQAGGREPVDRASALADYACVEALLAEEKPHLQPNVTAASVAERLGWAPERLTHALRHGGGTNFFDAVNSARLREVQALLALRENARVSLLTLAHEAGFGSKTAFYDAFQRHLGCTPAAWRRANAGTGSDGKLRSGRPDSPFSGDPDDGGNRAT